MKRQTLDDLLGSYQRMRDIGILGISLKFRRGRPYLQNDLTGEALSPVMSLKEMFVWMEAFEQGFQLGRR